MALRHRIPVDIRHFVVEAVFGSAPTKVIRYVEILEQDLTTVYRAKETLGFIDGSVSGDYQRTERKAFQLTLDNSDGDLVIKPGELWYDKYIRIYYGFRYFNTDIHEYEEWYRAIGTFMIDELDYGTYPRSIVMTGRDRTKKLLQSKFRYSTSFDEGEAMEDVVQAIALAGGIPLDQMSIPFPTNVFLQEDMLFEAGSTRWDALVAVTVPNMWEVRFQGDGTFSLEETKDFNTFESIEEISTGWLGTLEQPEEEKNVIKIRKKRRDTRLYNVVVVVGESANGVGVTAVAENNDPSSPTSTQEIGERVYHYKSPNITTVAQAQAFADQLLTVMGLEEYEADLETLVLPWIEEADLITFHHEEHISGEPTGFILMTYQIPLQLQSMKLGLRRIILNS